MILVCAATGRIGTKVIDLLRQKIPANEIAAGVRDVEKNAGLAKEGISVRKVDYQNPEEMAESFEGVEKLLLIPSFAPTDQRLKENLNVIDAAKKAGVKHISFISIMDTRLDSPLSFAWSYGETENALAESGLKSTVFRTSMYTDNLNEQIPVWLKTNELVTCAGDGKISYVSRDDIAESIVAFLAGPMPGENQTIYTLTGSVALSYEDVSKIVDSIYGSSIKMKHTTPEQFRSTIREVWGLSYGGKHDYIIEQTTNFQIVFSQGLMSKVTNHVEELTGHKPQEASEWLANHLLDYTPSENIPEKA